MAEKWMAVKFGLQSYSLRKIPYERAVATVRELGLSYIEAFPGHLPPEQKSISETRRLYERYRVKLLAHGVNAMPNDEKQLRNLFDFAKTAGVEVLTADPDPDSFVLLDKLVEEYKIAVAIHNHGPGHRYATIEEIMRAIQGHHNLIGMCLDTAHLARSSEDIKEAAERLGKRMYGLHLKDVDDKNKDTVVGEGRLDFEKLLLTLKKNGILGSSAIILEIELDPDNPVPAIKKSVENVQSILRRVIL